MYIEVMHGKIGEVVFYRKAYRKSRWLKSAKRTIKKTLDYKPSYTGIIVIL